jgi:type II secretory pathway component PulL
VFLAALSVLAAALTSNDAVDVEAVSFRAGVIDVRITTPDVETVGKIQRAVSASGQFAASIQSSDRVGERVNSRIQVREAGS